MAAVMMVAAVVGGAAGWTSSVTAQDAPASAWAYVWADDYTNAEAYTPNERYQFNSTGEPNTITRTDVGTYTVDMPGMGPGDGNVQVTAISETGERCNVAKRRGFVGTSAQQYVTCFAIGGEPVDIGFHLLYVLGTNPIGNDDVVSAWVYGTEETSEEQYSPVAEAQYSFAGEEITIARTEAGTYTVQLPGMATEAGNLQVNAGNNGETSGISCAVRRWELFEDESGKTVEVNCFDTTGTRVDTEFALAYVDGAGSSGELPATEGWASAYVWANQPNSPLEEAYTPSVASLYSSAAAENTVMRLADGAYAVALPEVASEQGLLLVTAFESAVSCTVAAADVEGTTASVGVLCFDAAGTPVNSPFMLMYVAPPSAA